MKAVRALFVTVALVLPGAAIVAPAAVAQPTPISTFKAANEPAAPVAGGELGQLKADLAACRQTVELDKKDESGMGYLVAAYMALWGILLVFFLFVQVRQSRLRAEMEELRSRLARLGGAS